VKRSSSPSAPAGLVEPPSQPAFGSIGHRLDERDEVPSVRLQDRPLGPRVERPSGHLRGGVPAGGPPGRPDPEYDFFPEIQDSYAFLQH